METSFITVVIPSGGGAEFKGFSIGVSFPVAISIASPASFPVVFGSSSPANSSSVPDPVGRYRGEGIWNDVKKLLDEVPNNTLALIDVRQAMPLQYTFCQHAFVPLFQALNSGRWSCKYVIFQMYDFHKSGFFRGVLKHLGRELPRKESEKGFIEAGFYTKLTLEDERIIRFIGKLSENQNKVLNVVNEMKVVTAGQVREKLKLSDEIIVDALRFLVEKYFLVGPSTESVPIPKYYSFYNYM